MTTLLVGLGNPGDQYSKTRHNAGFWLLDAIAQQQNVQWREEKKFFGLYTKIFIENRPVHLLKPQTFMNNSGRSVNAIAIFFQIPSNNIIVAHDELDLDEGISRIKYSGGHGGHNGLRDIISALNSKDFYRIRIGIGHPGIRNEVINYVLKSPSKEGMQKIENTIIDAERAFEIFIKDGSEKAMHWLHSKK
ncbi:aminoacyl-tRNA hydrolase [Suttonella ornithocola]|uniref:Peptidyl-tRNA hydrolase n=1 Tax=Suttonella ornithocola TaxID=279832 RepID=A0A380MP07_9GAMM|nr:aminoacyl-tRNA hydrolase [Suttonella ornithocola]SUO93766.1 Peptidyl-tRNA hydrolase [Suttonella ornithocola]